MAYAKLRTGSVLFVYPEDMGGGAEEGFYAEVTSCSRTEAFCKELAFSVGARSLALPLATAVQRTVPDEEPSGNAISRWLRRGAACRVGSHVCFGQVIGTAGAQVRLTTVYGARWVSDTDILGRVGPVFAMLMYHREWPAGDWDATTVNNANDTVSSLLEPTLNSKGILPPAPTVEELLTPLCVSGVSGDDRRLWEEPRTGIPRETTIDHAILYTYYENAPRPPPGDVKDLIGSSICDDPSLIARRRAPEPASVLGKRSHDGIQRSSGPNLDGDDDDDEREEKSSGPPAQRPPPPRRAPPVDVRAPYVNTWNGHLPMGSAPPAESTRGPNHYGGMLEEIRRATNAAIAASAATRVPTSKHTFNPPAVRMDVHRSLTNDAYAGTSPTMFLEAVLSSEYQKWRRVPGVLVRAYDFLFGRRGLSVMHFTSMDIHEQIAETEDRDDSTEDFSLAVKAPTPRRPSAWAELHNGIAGFIQYCSEFCDHFTTRVAMTLVGFVSAVQASGTWEESHLRTLEYWINGKLLEYRGLVHTDMTYQTTTREQALAWFAPTNPSLEQLRSMLVIKDIKDMRERTAARPAAPPTNSTTRPAGKRQAERQTPTAVVEALPKDDHGRELCLKFASQKGCKGRREGRCNFNDRGHFVAARLPAVVVKHIKDRFGDLSDAQKRV